LIDTERMLGSLVRNAIGGGRRGRRRRRGSSFLGLRKSALGLGALGVAIAAFEHFTQQKTADVPPGLSSPPPVPLPPLPGPPVSRVHAAGVGTLVPPPPPGSTEDRDEALLLVHAMIAAANADHRIDDEERRRILEAMHESGVGAEEREFLLGEFENPMDLATLASHAAEPDLARRVYLASLMAIDVDTPAEANYLARLAERLGLDHEQVQELESILEGEQ
jgi:uncharacterized membrane protein YebE (DUF533 family)